MSRAPARGTHIALLRGINVGGKNRLPMKDLAAMFAESGCTDVRTYIQSGNIVFTAGPKLVERVPGLIAKAIGDFGLMSPSSSAPQQRWPRWLATIPLSRTVRLRNCCTLSFSWIALASSESLRWIQTAHLPMSLQCAAAKSTSSARTAWHGPNSRHSTLIPDSRPRSRCAIGTPC